MSKEGGCVKIKGSTIIHNQRNKMKDINLRLNRNFFDFELMKDVEVDIEVAVKEEHMDKLVSKLCNSFKSLSYWINGGSKRLRKHSFRFGGKTIVCSIFSMSQNEYVIDILCQSVKVYTNEQLAMLFHAVDRVVSDVLSFAVCYECNSNGNVLSVVFTGDAVEEMSAEREIEVKGEFQKKLL